MTTEQVGRAKSWLEEFYPVEQFKDLENQWKCFAASEHLVATLFGAYDTGKSAILRRLLVENSLEVPEWVTISARHETFEVGTVEFRGVVLRDTPGVAPGAADARGVANTGHALAAVELTDVLLVVMNPQLPTAERDLVLGVLAGDWPAGSLALVISRFDDAGVSPEYDLDGYHQLAERKINELRHSLSLDPAISVFVVAPDFEQAAGGQRQPDVSIWNESRPWDGMTELSDALAELAGAELPALREAAEIRYWLGSVATALDQAHRDLQDLKAATQAARSLRARRDTFIAEIDAQEKASRVSINAAVEDAIRSTMRRQSVDAAAIDTAVNQTLDAWWSTQRSEADRVVRDAQATMELQRERPVWKSIMDMYVADEDAKSGSQRKFTSQVGGLAEKAKEAVRAVDKVREEAKKGLKERAAETNGGANRSVQAASNVPKVEVAIAALPVVLELVGMVEDFVGDKKAAADRQRRRAELQDQVTAIATRAGEETMAHWSPQLDEVRAHLVETMGSGAEDAELLESLLSDATALIGRGEAALVQDVQYG